MKAPVLLVAWFAVQLRAAAPSSCALPPLKWCSSLDSARQCRVLKQCLEYNSTRSHQRAEPVHVGVYFESLCPDCIYFLSLMLFPTWILLDDIMSLTVIPYGNAREIPDGQRFMFQCQNGEQECLVNTIETCLLNMTDLALPIIFCMESSSDVINSAKSCVELYAPRLGWDAIMNCVTGDLGNQLMHQNALKTKALKPPHKFVPWVTINGVHTEELQQKATSSLYSLVCSLYKGPRTPACGGSQR